MSRKDPRFDPAFQKNVQQARDDNKIVGNEIAFNTVLTNHIAAGVVTNEKLAADSVSTVNIVNNAVTTAKIADNSITTAKLVNESVTGDKIASTITGQKTFSSNLNINDYITMGSGADWNLLREERMNGLGAFRVYRVVRSTGSLATGPALFSMRCNKGWTNFALRVFIEQTGYLGTSTVYSSNIYLQDGTWLLYQNWSQGTSSGPGFSIGTSTYNSGGVDSGFADFFMNINLPAYTTAQIRVETINLSRVSSFSGNSWNQIVFY